MKKILLSLIAPFIAFALSAAGIGTTSHEEADAIVLKHLSQETRPYTLYVTKDLQKDMHITSSVGELLELNYWCWVYYVSYTDTNQGRYIIIKEANGNLLEVDAKSDAKPEDLAEWEEIEQNIFVCGVNDPLKNIEWLREYCESLNETQNFSSVSIELYKVIDTNEYVFKIGTSYSEFDYFPCPYTMDWRNCIGKLIFGVSSCVSPNPGLVEEFLKDKEFVAELFYFVKQ